MSALGPPSGQVPGGIQVFISYRRKDTAGHAGRLYDTLRARLDSPQIFMDIDAIEAGVDFVDVINEAVGKCDVLLAVIGPDWLSLKNDAGERRIDEPGDFVRIEIEAALSRDVRVIPVLVDGGRMPSVAQLPASLATFGRRHALEISDARWGFDAGRLVESIEKIAVAKADDAARVAAAVVAAEAARVAADAAAADAEAARLAAEARASEDARLAADSAAAEEARRAEEVRLATAAAAAAAAAEHARQMAEAAAAEDERLAEAARASELAAAEDARPATESAVDDDRAGAAATSAVAIGSAGAADTTDAVDPDSPTGTWPVSAGAVTAAQRPPGRQNLPRYAAPIAAVLVLALGLGTVVLGAGVLGGGAQASPSQAAVASPSLPVPSGVYVAVAGDTLASVAGKFGVTIVALAAANPGLSPSDVLPVGQIVVVPGSEPDPTVLPSGTPSDSVAPSSSAPPSAPPPSKPPPATATPQPPPPRDTTPPSSPKVTIKGNTVFSTKVDLTLSATGATQMQIGNLVSGSCDWKPWRDYAKTYDDWTISGGSGGTRTVCVHFRDSASPPNVSGTAKDSTYYDRKPSAASKEWYCYAPADAITYAMSPIDWGTPDPDGDKLTITNASVATGYGSVTFTATKISYSTGDSHPPWWTSTINYTINDGHPGGSSSGVITMNMSATYDPGCS